MAPKVYGPVGPNNADYNSVPLPPPPIFDPTVYENVYQWKVITEDLPEPKDDPYGNPIRPVGSMMGVAATHPPDVVRKVGITQSGYARYLEDYKLWMQLCATIRHDNYVTARANSALSKQTKQLPMLRCADGTLQHLSAANAKRFTVPGANGEFARGTDVSAVTSSSEGLKFAVVTVDRPPKVEPAAPDPNSKRQLAKTAKKSYKLALTTAIGERKQQLVPQVATLVADRKLNKLEERASISVRERASNIKKVNGSQPVDLHAANGDWKLVVGKRATRHRERTTTIRRDDNGRPLGRKIVSAVSFDSSAEED